MSISTKLRWKRAVNELRFLHEELALLKEICSSANAPFQEYYEKFCRQRNIDIPALNAKYSERLSDIYGTNNEAPSGDMVDEEARFKEGLLDACDSMIARFQGEHEPTTPPEIEDKEVHDSFTKLFKAIASKVHPDKAQDEFTQKRFEAKFKEAKAALDYQKYFKLLEMAEELDIELPKNYNEQVKWMKKENKKISQLAQQQRMTYNYLFAEAPDDATRDNLIRSFLKQLFGLEVE